MRPIKKYTDKNRIAWDAIADIRAKKWRGAEFFANGGSIQDEHELKAAGDVQGLKLCHLQCATGEETLSWANHGADATGVDISPRQIELAKQKANDAGLSVRFLAADVYALPDSLDDGSFDIVVTGGGALMWLPDLQRWAEIVANLLKPGGRLILYEMHPLAGCLEVEDGQLKLGDDYFGRKKPLVYTGWTHFPGAENTPETKYEFAWPLGDVVTSVVQAGLRLESLEEFPNDAEWKFHDMLNEVKRLPGSFLLVASKERAS